MGTVQKIRDGLVNFASRLGTSADKATYGTYTVPVAGQHEIDAAYRTSWFRKIVETIPFDEVREWRTWQGDTGTETTPIEEFENRHNIRQKIMLGRVLGRKDGGAALYMGGLPGLPDTEINIERVTKDALKFVTLFTKYEISPRERDMNPLSPNYGQASYYEVTGDGQSSRIHPSRIIRFPGLPRNDAGLQWDGWDDSLWTYLCTAIRDADSSASGVAALIQEAKIDVISVPGLMAKISTAEYESRLTTRFQVANTLKSINNVLLIDSGNEEGKGGETFTQKVLNFAGFPEIMDRLQQIMAGMSEIPTTRLMGRSPAGMNSTGESDMRNYYDAVRARQEIELTPLMHPLDEVVIRSALGSRPPDLYYEWNPLYSLDEKEAATVEKSFAEGLKIRVETGLYDDAVLAKAEQNRMIESGRYPGLESAIEESDDEDGIKNPDEEEAKEVERMTREAEIANANNPPLRVAANDVERIMGHVSDGMSFDDAAALVSRANMMARIANGVGIDKLVDIYKDAAPRTLYVRRDVVNRAEITKWAKAQGFTDIVPDLHVTIAYSRQPVDWFSVGQSWSDKLDIAAGGPRQMEALGPEKQYAALLITASELVWRHKEILEAGATWDWPDYQPHISIQIGGDIDLSKVEPYQGRIVLGPEIFETVRE